MNSFRAWQEVTDNDHDPYDEVRVLTVFPIERGFLITARTKFVNKDDPMVTFGHQEVTFFASFEQANEIAHVMLSHVWARRRPETPLSL